MTDAELSDLLRTAYQNAPPVLQRYITSGSLEQFIASMQQKYSLPPDVAGRLSDEVLMLMLGIIDPKELVDSLGTNVLIPDENIGPLVDDINDHVFKPLQAQAQAAPQQSSLNTAPVTQPMQITAPPAPVAVPPPRPMAPPVVVQPSIVAAAPVAFTPPAAPMPIPMPTPSPAEPPPPLSPKSKNDDLHQVLKSYGIDPYREPPE